MGVIFPVLERILSLKHTKDYISVHLTRESDNKLRWQQFRKDEPTVEGVTESKSRTTPVICLSLHQYHSSVPWDM